MGFRAALALAVALLGWVGAAVAQPRSVPPGGCRPVAERKSELGCWNIADQAIGKLNNPQTFWHLDTYPNRAAAEAAKGPHGTVVEAEGKVWLLTIEDQANWRASGGERVADIGPLPVRAGAAYSTRYLDAVFEPGTTADEHRHAGPEAWYTIAGETCLETSEGTQGGRAGGPPVIVPEGLPMHLTATGTALRRALVLILYETGKPVTTPAHDWKPKGLCKR
jgi:quercetin dioxygenase-like cupin family protein